MGNRTSKVTESQSMDVDNVHYYNDHDRSRAGSIPLDRPSSNYPNPSPDPRRYSEPPRNRRFRPKEESYDIDMGDMMDNVPNGREQSSRYVDRRPAGGRREILPNQRQFHYRPREMYQNYPEHQFTSQW